MHVSHRIHFRNQPFNPAMIRNHFVLQMRPTLSYKRPANLLLLRVPEPCSGFPVPHLCSLQTCNNMPLTITPWVHLKLDLRDLSWPWPGICSSAELWVGLLILLESPLQGPHAGSSPCVPAVLPASHVSLDTFSPGLLGVRGSELGWTICSVQIQGCSSLWSSWFSSSPSCRLFVAQTSWFHTQFLDTSLHMVDPKLMVLLTVGSHHASSWACGCLHGSEPPGLLLLGWPWILHWTMSSGKAAAGFHAHLSLAVPGLHQDVWLTQFPPCNTPNFSPGGGLSVTLSSKPPLPFVFFQTALLIHWAYPPWARRGATLQLMG